VWGQQAFAGPCPKPSHAFFTDTQQPRRYPSEMSVPPSEITLSPQGDLKQPIISMFICSPSHSDLPLIVSLEVHTCPAQQEIMVDIIRDMWAPYLVDLNALTGHEISLPTLESLRKKILIKVCRPPLLVDVRNSSC